MAENSKIRQTRSWGYRPGKCVSLDIKPASPAGACTPSFIRENKPVVNLRWRKLPSWSEYFPSSRPILHSLLTNTDIRGINYRHTKDKDTDIRGINYRHTRDKDTDIRGINYRHTKDKMSVNSLLMQGFKAGGVTTLYCKGLFCSFVVGKDHQDRSRSISYV